MGGASTSRSCTSRIPAVIVAVCLLACTGCGVATGAAGTSTAPAESSTPSVGTASVLGSAPDRAAASPSDDGPRPALGAEEPGGAAPAPLGAGSAAGPPSALAGTVPGGVVIDDGGGPITVQPMSPDQCVLRELDGLEIPGFELDPRPTAEPEFGAGTGCSAGGVITPHASTGAGADFEFDISIPDGRADVSWAALRRVVSSSAGRFEFGADDDVIVEYGDNYVSVTRRLPATADRLEPTLVVVTAYPEMSLDDAHVELERLRAFYRAIQEALDEVTDAVDVIRSRR